MAKKMIAANILRIVDIDKNQFSAECLEYLQEQATPTYKDVNMNEHIYNPEDTILDAEENEAPEQVIEELRAADKLVTKRKAAYYRVCYI